MAKPLTPDRRLASKAGPGEVLMSDATYTAAGLDLGNLEQRALELKGKSEPVNVRVARVSARRLEVSL